MLVTYMDDMRTYEPNIYASTKEKRLLMQLGIELLERNHKQHFILIKICMDIHFILIEDQQH